MPSLALTCAKTYMDRAITIVFGNGRKRLDFPFDMKVSDLHHDWFRCATRANRIAARLRREADVLDKQIKALSKRSPEKAPLRTQIGTLRSMADDLVSIPEMVFVEAQARLMKRLERMIREAGRDPDDFHDEYIETISRRPGVEWCWDMTLEAVCRDLLGLNPSRKAKPSAPSDVNQEEFAFFKH